jgi:hypothetical protein
MKMTVTDLDGSPTMSKPRRQTLFAYDFTEENNYTLATADRKPVAIPLDEDSVLVLDAHYSPGNFVLSLIVGHQTSDATTNILNMVARVYEVPTSVSYRLPQGKFVEFGFVYVSEET